MRQHISNILLSKFNILKKLCLQCLYRRKTSFFSVIMQKFYDHFFAINIFIEIKDIGLDCFFAGIVDSWLGSDVGNAVVNFVFPVDFRNIHTIWRQ